MHDTNDDSRQIEKRRFPRVSLDFATVEVYSPGGTPESPELCFVINLSQNGMMFRGERIHAPGQRLRITFSLPHSDVMIKTDAVVVHKRELSESRFYGVQFQGLGLAEQRVLKDFVGKTAEQNG